MFVSSAPGKSPESIAFKREFASGRLTCSSTPLTPSAKATRLTIKLAESISGEESRQRAVTRIAYQWAREEPSAALEYVNSSTVIGEESRERIAEMAERAAAGEEPERRGFDGPGRPRGR